MTGKTYFSRSSLNVSVFALFFILGPWISPVLTGAAKPSADKVPAPILKWSEVGSPYVILVDKSVQKVFVYHKENPHSPQRTYDCSTGENEGPKLQQNDRKTPEGIYFFTREYGQRELAPIYGIKAFALDYPNHVDKMDGKGGYGIWFHGLNKPLKPRDTNGCIALVNEDMEELTPIMRFEDTPVVIVSRIEMVSPSEVEREQKKLLQVIETWRSGWETEDIDKYMSAYSSLFRSSGKNWHQWRAYKERLANQYKKIRVKIQNLRILKNDGLVMASFVQRYSNEHFGSAGRKTLYFRRNSEEWKIIGEYFESGEIMPVMAKAEPASTPPPPAPMKKESSGQAARPASEAKTQERRATSDITEIRDFLARWEKAWEEKNLGGYLSCYDSSFQSGGMNLKAWKTHKEKLNGKYRSIVVDMQDLKIEQASPFVATASFRQKYEADDYRDEGMKNLLLVKRGKTWKIKEEEWRPLDKESRL
jgi:murein L,D-transpeptidase YafK